jgi:hypothetical protein
MLWKQLSPRYRQLLRNGSRGQAVVVDAEEEATRSDKAGIYGWNVTIRVKNLDGTTSDFKRYIEAKYADGVSAGMVVPIRYDPNKRSRVEIDTEEMRAQRDESGAKDRAAEEAAVAQAESEIDPIE